MNAQLRNVFEEFFTEGCRWICEECLEEFWRHCCNSWRRRNRRSRPMAWRISRCPHSLLAASSSRTTSNSSLGMKPTHHRPQGTISMASCEFTISEARLLSLCRSLPCPIQSLNPTQSGSFERNSFPTSNIPIAILCNRCLCTWAPSESKYDHRIFRIQEEQIRVQRMSHCFGVYWGLGAG